MSSKLWILFCLFAFLSVPALSSPAEDSSKHDLEETRSLVFAQSKEAVEDLLLFWEEKDLFVETATRYQKKISKTAENITVITAKEIEDMNAHTVSEVLNRISGIFVDFAGQDFGSEAQLYIQGSEARHVLVMLDGVTWNFLSGGNAETNSIPVSIIKKIEIIKGPASSAWGSSLGGVINIITKDEGDRVKPTGTISATIGEGNSQDDRAELSGKAGSIGYFLFAGRQDSNGIEQRRYFENRAALYAKVSIPVSKDTKIGLTAGYSEPHIKYQDSQSYDMSSKGKTRVFFATASLSSILSEELTLDISLNTFRHKYSQYNDVFSTGDLYMNTTYDEKTTGGSARLIWNHGVHTAVAGIDISHGELDQAIESGPFLQSIGSPGISKTDPDIDKWALFANDTITLGKFSITPGIRFDHNSVTGDFTSPSIGATYSLSKKTILRASVSRGFTVPPLSSTSGGALFLDPNPSLKPERVWSYQAGVESSLSDLLWIKATLFRHDMKDELVKELYAAGPPSYNDLVFNKGEVKRKGIEIEAETAPVYNTSLKAGLAYVEKESDTGTRKNSAANIALKYDDKRSFLALLSGHYIWWDLPEEAMADYNSFIWDLNMRKKIYTCGKTTTELFITGHNIFSGTQYSLGDYKNPGRWVEAGVRIKF